MVSKKLKISLPLAMYTHEKVIVSSSLYIKGGVKITLISNISPPTQCISESCIKIKINSNFYFHHSSKGFMKALKAFIKPFETPQRSVKIKI